MTPAAPKKLFIRGAQLEGLLNLQLAAQFLKYCLNCGLPLRWTSRSFAFGKSFLFKASDELSRSPKDYRVGGLLGSVRLTSLAGAENFPI